MTYKTKFNKFYNYPHATSHSIKEISKITGYDLKGLQTIYDKGMGAYFSNPQSVRPSVKSPEQWAFARVYSAVMGGKSSKIDAKHLISDNIMKIINVIPSIKKNKKYTAILSSGKEYSFGLDGSQTYLNHKDKKKRENYWKRHYVRKEKELIDNLVPSPSLFSAYLLWGLYDNLEENINYLNELFEKNL